MSAYQNLPWETDLFFSLSGVPATGILYNQVVVNYKMFGVETLTTRTLQSGELIELGDGFYTLTWPSIYTTTLGTFMYTGTSAYFDNFIYDTFDVEPQPLALLTPPGICVVTGNIVDIGGAPAQNIRVSFRSPEFPVITGGSIVDSNRVYTVPDVMGNFSVNLIQGQTVIVEIETAGIYAQITVPAASNATLVSLLPP